MQTGACMHACTPLVPIDVPIASDLFRRPPCLVLIMRSRRDNCICTAITRSRLESVNTLKIRAPGLQSRRKIRNGSNFKIYSSRPWTGLCLSDCAYVSSEDDGCGRVTAMNTFPSSGLCPRRIFQDFQPDSRISVLESTYLLSVWATSGRSIDQPLAAQAAHQANGRTVRWVGVWLPAKVRLTSAPVQVTFACTPVS